MTKLTQFILLFVLLPTICLSPLTTTSAIAAEDSPTAVNAIKPGEVWQDTAGNVIQAHGAGMIQVGKTFYWFGEDHTGQTTDQSFQNVKCYASTDLVHWAFRNNALTRQANGDLGPSRVVERPKVLFNRKTGLYVMYMHIDSRNYAEAKVGVATCNTVDGTYTYRGSFRPLDHESRDMTLFQDNDGTGYLIFEDRKRGLSISQLTPDYLGVDHEVVLVHEALEAPAMIHLGDTYYLLGSSLSGWDANPNHYATATSLAGPWSVFKDVAPRATKTYDSQTASILPVLGSQATSYIYMGDRWGHGKNLQDARYIWLPLTVHDRSLSLPSDAPWTINVETGRVAAAK